LTRAAGAVLLLASALLLGFGASPASAHAVLEKTSPVEGSTVDTVPSSVSLTFDEPPQTKFSVVHVTGPDGKRKDAGAILLTNSVVSESFVGTRPAGRYVVDWRVISDDGHPVSGQFSFTARTAAPDIFTSLGGKSSNGSGPGSSNTAGIIIGVVGGLVVIGGLLALYARRRRRPAEPAAHE
jgi:hypothetical protein